jgi:flagellar assembly protein FliH
MSESVIPKERLTAYQRWELPSFDPGDRAENAGQRVSVKSLPTAEQLEQLHGQAHEEGYQAGYAEGAQRVAEEVQRITALAESMGKELLRIDEQIVQDVLNLSLEIAKQMVHQALQVEPELVLNVVRDAIASLPHFNQGAHLILHPEDAGLVRKHTGEQLGHSGWKIFEDPHVERGGLRVETAHSQIDATLDARWRRIAASLEQNNVWLKRS